MSLFSTSLVGISQDAVDEQRALLVQQHAEAYPRLDTRFGVIHDTIIELWSVLQALQQTNLTRLQSSISLRLVTQDPTLADDGVVDGLLSNYGLVRQAGKAATGNIVIVIDSLSPVSVGAGVQFFANGVTFATETAYAAKVSEDSVDSDTDRVLESLGDGTYRFSIPVVALEPGAQGSLRRNTRLTTDLPLSTLVRVYAESDFSGGNDTETNESLLARLNTGWAVKSWSNRTNIEALIRHDTRFSAIVAVSIIGYGDTEMSRDKHGICPVAHGGRTDIYVRTQQLYQSVSVTLSATYMGRSDAGGVWQLSVGTDDGMPGFYRIDGITAKEAGNVVAVFLPSSDSRSFSLPETRAPDIVSAEEAAYSVYQTTTVQFVDTLKPVTGLTIGQTADYVVTLQGMPLLSELQEFCLDENTGPTQCDVLVRGPIPCFVSVSFVIYQAAGGDAISLDTVKAAISKYVNTTGFIGSLYATAISKVAAENLPGDVNIGQIELLGAVVLPTGETVRLRSFDRLEIPSSGQASSKTVCFYLDTADVVIATRNM